MLFQRCSADDQVLIKNVSGQLFLGLRCLCCNFQPTRYIVASTSFDETLQIVDYTDDRVQVVQGTKCIKITNINV